MKALTGILIFILCALSAGSPAYAQNRTLEFRSFTIDNGLSQNTVFALLEDRDGIIWVGTEDGLNKFDGYEFSSFKHKNSDTSSISNNQINALFEDDKTGEIWIGTANGLNVYNKKTEKFSRLTTVKQNTNREVITSIYKDKQGRIWLTSLNGLQLFDPVKRTFSLYNFLANTRADKVLEDSKGILWVSINKDLRRFDPKTQKFQALPAVLEKNKEIRDSYIRVLKEDHLQRLWIGTETAGLFIYDPRRNTVEQYKHQKDDDTSLAADIVRDVYFQSEEEVWVATRNGLSILNLKTRQFRNYRKDPYDPSSISQNSVRTILKDRAGNSWLGTFGGGLNLVPNRQSIFNHIKVRTTRQSGLSHQMVSAITSARNGGVWIGTEGGGLNLSTADLSSFTTYSLPQTSDNIAENTVKSLLRDGDDLWIGKFQTLSHFDGKRNTFKDIPVPTTKSVTALAKTEEGMWLGTNGDGLILLKPDGNTVSYKSRSTDQQSISNNNVSKILTDADGNLWITTDNGLNFFDKKSFTHFYYNQDDPYSISASSTSAILIDRNKRLWIGTKGAGLNLFDGKTKRFYVIDESHGLANDAIKSIEEDKDGQLWVSSNKGISKIVVKADAPFSSDAVEISNYFVEDGLQSNQFMINASFRSDNGTLFFGGINGVSYFSPEQIRKNLYKPPLIFVEFMIRNKRISEYHDESPLKQSINETEEITLTHDQSSISFKFAALNFVNPLKNEYAYKLEGLKNDDDWHFVGNQRIATFTNLDAGTYYLKVKAANNDRHWNDTERTIKITILPPWWKTWWAYALYVAVFIALLYTYLSYRLKNAKLESKLAYEHLIREKDQELYQRKLNFFTNISHEIKTPLTLILAPLEKLVDLNQGNNRIHNQISLMKRNGERLIRLVNQLLDFRKFESGDISLKASTGDVVTFVKEVVSAFEGYASHVDISIGVESTTKRIEAWFDRDKFEKIIYNLLSNALKFTRPGGKIVVRIDKHTSESVDDGWVVIAVEDNGIGISADKIPKIFDQFKHFDEEGLNLQGTGIGLAFTKALVELHHGDISVESTVETSDQKGRTCFTVKLPLGKAHFKEDEILSDYNDGEDIAEYHYGRTDTLNTVLEDRAASVIAKMEEKPFMLIVEDNKDVMEFLKDHFEEKFQIITATDGEEGLKQALDSLPDIIISDVMMPKMNGTALCSAIKTDSKTSHIPVILLTARTPLIYKIEGLETGADDYITKPFSIQVVEARVWNLLEQRQQLRERYRKEITLSPKNLAITSSDEAFLEKIMDYIEKNLADPNLNVENLAAEVFMSRATLYRKIKALTSQAPVDFIRTVRLKRAAQLLTSKTFSVSEVAFQTGFTEVNYFRKCFKEYFNKTPTQYTNSTT